ncbi:SDR family oxidoreductase [Rubrivirga sp. S365]|uniref:SDR family NAD(P)-dependent oxidoreductase n=1 Tax=Rubrivirga sp. S365 TaxID=3076080 RepID=UPI0028CAF589|nr:SDR family oxidoreductase [Rubrivirga sp. S365]MDT7856217.1 SDR family oxidoreductase [Rubrivirga sp. S365]
MPLDYTGRTALVTGASGGIGADLARGLAARGARVLLVARSADRLDAVADEIRGRGGAAEALVADLEPPGAAGALAARLDGAGERVSVLVNNAGFGVQGPFLDASAEAAEGVIGLNVTALTSLTRRLLPSVVAERGGVLNVASTSAFVPAPGLAVYAATKAYVLSFTEALHAELGGAGVRVTCLCPGPVPTGFAERAGMGDRFFAGGLSSERVAREGLDGLARGRLRVVPGWTNKVQVAATRFTPPALALRVARAVVGRGDRPDAVGPTVTSGAAIGARP